MRSILPLGPCTSALLVLGTAGSACAPAEREKAPLHEQVLVDATESYGLDFVHDCGDARGHYFPEIMGSGVALLDLEADGDLDLYLVNAGPDPRLAPGESAEPNRLFRQEGGRFVEVTERSGTGHRGYGMGAAAADADGDGDDDLFVTNVGSDVFYSNRGDGTFVDDSLAAGFDEEGWSTSAAFADLDRDGDLDLFVARYVELDASRACRDAAGRPDYCGPTDFPPAADRLYENTGEGRFREVGGELSLRADPRRGLGVAVCDLTGDGWLDVYVANDGDPNQLWVRGADGRLRDEALLRGVAYDAAGGAQAGMGVVCADVDTDGDLDLVLSHLRGESTTAYLQERAGEFRDGSARLGLVAATRTVTGFGLAAADFDRDGALDLFQVNGHVTRAGQAQGAAEGFFAAYAQPATLLWNLADAGSRTARDVAFLPAAVGRGLALGDLDGDGDGDLVATATAGRARILSGAPPAGAERHWLRIVLRDARGRPAHGASLVVRAGQRAFGGWIPAGGSYLSSSEPAAFFGLGPAESFDELLVRWPDGRSERFPGGRADRSLVLVEGQGG